MSFYFKQNGQVNKLAVTLSAGTFTTFYLFTFCIGISQVTEPGMMPILSSLDENYNATQQNISFRQKLMRFAMADKVLYSKLIPNKMKNLQGKLVAIQNPYNRKQVIFRRLVASEQFWVKRLDDGGIIEIPNAHVWVECECESPTTQRNLDSITTFGPLSQAFVLGEVTAIVWPIQRIAFFSNIEKYARIKNFISTGKKIDQVYQKRLHSQVYTSEQITELFQ